MEDGIVKFINKHSEEIDSNNFGYIYGEAYFELELARDIGDLTEAFLRADIDPLQHLSYIPSYYLCGADITEFKVPDHIRKIGDYAFNKCKILVFIHIPKSVEYVSDKAFYGVITQLMIEYEGSIEDWNKIAGRSGFKGYILKCLEDGSITYL